MGNDSGDKDLDNALYVLSDVLDCTVLLRNGEVSADFKRAVKCGPLAVNMTVRMRSDYVGQRSVGVLIHFKGSLWAYQVVRVGGGGSTLSEFYLFDGGSGSFEDLKKGKRSDTLAALNGRIVASYLLSADGAWRVANAKKSEE